MLFGLLPSLIYLFLCYIEKKLLYSQVGKALRVNKCLEFSFLGALLLILISYVVICKSFWIKASAK